MDKVWPNMDYSQINLVLFYIDEDMNIKEAWVLNTQEIRELKEDQYQDLFPPSPGGYEELEFEGRPSISMSASDESLKDPQLSESTYLVATHELVHFYFQ